MRERERRERERERERKLSHLSGARNFFLKQVKKKKKTDELKIV